ncbi:N-acetyl-gamma-glutamyl-phosphate reductase [Corallincola luteus]|uniref:N-acetyl-gamma-glutamyl-phosphate reductase n=1 Tax=Corallincola luteus TaxID=1775177 RepID=A0ABY2ANC2_9GAMM|nr:N-acetyl-gamma-glutamyl-phosphate reductase [Corallincola luteus]TCI04502.1 N-acetyl-gamma-glutamyl-phosphate reductase [Corallincola luteus]
MVKCSIIGASGYTGAELANLVEQHPQMTLKAIYVSERSADADTELGTLHRRYLGQLNLPLTPLATADVAKAAEGVDVVFLATDHKVSVALAPGLLETGVTVMDLSGGFRFDTAAPYYQFYGFTHDSPEWLEQAVYGLAEWNAAEISHAQLVAVPGCYPTASLLALKPLQEAGLLKSETTPVINAVSGVSGAGRKASMVNSFCEVSYNPYGVLNHRHQPEIALHLGNSVIFTPHLGNFPRGIVATITAQLADGVTAAAIDQAYDHAYAGKPAVRLYNQLSPGHWPSIGGVANTPYCDIGWKADLESGHIVIGSAIDNLLKGAASQAIQCANIRFGLTNYPISKKAAL